MNDLSDLTKAPVLYKCEDKTFEVSPLTQADFGAICRYAQFAPYYALAELDGVSDEDKRTLQMECARRPVRFNSEEFLNSLDSAWGSIEVVFQSLRHKHTDITREMVSSWSPKHIGNVEQLALMISSILPDETVKKNLPPLIKRLRTEKLLPLST